MVRTDATSREQLRARQPGDESPRGAARVRLASWWPTARRDLLLLGCYLSLRGYHSLDGDQAYRLPLLLHWLDPSLYAGDPFVRAFDQFNPHRGWLGLLAGLTAVMGLAAALALVFAVTFLATCRGVDRLARATWPDLAGSAGTIAVALLLLAKAGNIGTNHLFEAMVLDRLLAMGLGWNAIAEVVTSPGRGALRPSALLGLAAVVHPSMGLQLACVVAGTWGFCGILGRATEVPLAIAIRGMVLAPLAVVPGLLLNLQSGHLLTQGLPSEVFWNLAVELQSPQHMLPHLWRLPQWLAWFCYLVLAALAVGSRVERPVAERRLLVMLSLVLAWLGASWVAVEVVRHTRITVFQPFRMATLARGIALILIAGRVGSLWRSESGLGRTRALLIVLGLTNDWSMVVVTAAEALTSLAVRCRAMFEGSGAGARRALGRLPEAVLLGSLAAGIVFLNRHDTEYGHRPLLIVLGVWVAAHLARRRFRDPALEWRPRRRFAGVAALAWAVPVLALLVGLLPEESSAFRSGLVRGLIARCRFTAVPVDDIERLALWCRDNTPATARFIGPPGPKTFRLWSRRSLVFNRAGSPYHAAGLADWFARFQDVVDSREPPGVFVRQYQSDRQRLEGRYDHLSPFELAELAARQDADHVIAAAPGAGGAFASATDSRSGPLELLHVEGRRAVYRLSPGFAETPRNSRPARNRTALADGRG